PSEPVRRRSCWWRWPRSSAVTSEVLYLSKPCRLSSRPAGQATEITETQRRSTIGVGRSGGFPLPPNRTSGSPASGSPVGGSPSYGLTVGNMGRGQAIEPLCRKERVRPALMSWSTPAAPPLALTCCHAALSVRSAQTLSIRLYQTPPFTTCSSAVRMRTLHPDGSVHDRQ